MVNASDKSGVLLSGRAHTLNDVDYDYELSENIKGDDGDPCLHVFFVCKCRYLNNQNSNFIQ